MGLMSSAVFGGTLCMALTVGSSVLAQEGAPPGYGPPPAPMPAAGAMTHDGFYLQLAAGLGYLSSTASMDLGPLGDFEATYSGVSFPFQLKIGGSPIPGLVIGGGFLTDYAFSPSVESEGVSGTVDGTLYFFGIGPFVSFYPDPKGGLHFDALVGFGALQACDSDSCGSSATGLVLSLEAGYEFWVGDEWSIGPAFRFGYGAFSLDEADYPTIAPALLATFTYH